MQKQNLIFVATIFLVVLLSLFHSGEALKCYQCTNADSATCEDKPAETEESECIGATACVKLTMQIQGKHFVARSCGAPGVCKLAKEVYNLKDCAECTTDLCNGSTANAVSIVMMLTSGVITLLWTTQ